MANNRLMLTTRAQGSLEKEANETRQKVWDALKSKDIAKISTSDLLAAILALNDKIDLLLK